MAKIIELKKLKTLINKPKLGSREDTISFKDKLDVLLLINMHHGIK